MFSGLQIVTPALTTPVSVADAKAHSRILTDLDDQLLAGYISSATRRCENICKRAFMPQTWSYSLSHFPGRSNPTGYQLLSEPNRYYSFNHIEIPLPPLLSIVSFTYLDTAGTSYNMTQGFGNLVGNYILDTAPEPGRIVLPFSGIWPTTILLPGSPIQIVYTCGYTAYSGVASIDSTGLVTWVSGTNFDAGLSSTWITIGGVSFNVTQFISPTSLRVAPSGTAAIVPQTNGTYTGNNLPMPIRQAILFMTAHFYENREPVITGRSQTAVEIPGTVDDLLGDYRIFLGVAA